MEEWRGQEINEKSNLPRAQVDSDFANSDFAGRTGRPSHAENLSILNIYAQQVKKEGPGRWRERGILRVQ